MSKRKLLLADDSLTIQKVINLTFADEGFDVFTVGSGTAAISRIMDLKPDIVLADVQMPGLNGYEVCEQIRGIGQFQNLPVVLLVGAGENYDETEAKRVGANDFLVKQPFQSTRQVVEKVVAILAAADSGNLDAASETPEIMVATDDNEKNEVQDDARNVSADFQETVASNEVQTASETVDNMVIEATILDEIEAAPFAAIAVTDFDDGSADDEMIETSAGSAFVVAAKSLSLTGEEVNQASSETTEADFEIVENNVTKVIDADSFEAAELEINQTVFAAATGEIQASNFDFDAASFELQTTTVEAEVTTSEPTAPDVIEFAEMPALNVALKPEELSFAPSPAAESDAEVVPQPEFETVGGASDAPATNSFNPNAAADFSFASSQNSAAINDPAVLEIDLDDDSLLELGDDFQHEALAETETPILEMTEQPNVEIQTETNESAAIAPPVSQNESENQQTQQFNPTAIDNLNFPPEVIEAIANKVVEKLSDKVIEKIAWEIVPDRFDLIVRKHIDKRER